MNHQGSKEIKALVFWFWGFVVSKMFQFMPKDKVFVRPFPLARDMEIARNTYVYFIMEHFYWIIAACAFVMLFRQYYKPAALIIALQFGELIDFMIIYNRPWSPRPIISTGMLTIPVSFGTIEGTILFLIPATILIKRIFNPNLT